ncbi:hypothetical protein P5V15_015290 [Pogonomyrmex californicus]
MHPGSHLIRWRLKLEEYDYEIIHKAGKANANADTLSRNVAAITEEQQTDDAALEKQYEEEDKKYYTSTMTHLWEDTRALNGY